MSYIHSYADEMIEAPCGNHMVGTAYYKVHLENDYSADIGGDDGLVADSATLMRFEVGGLKMTPEMVLEFADRAAIARLENDATEAVQNMIDNGDFAESA